MFDPQKLAELVDEEARIAQAIQELAVKLNDQHATDGTWDDARLARYTADQQRHGQLTRELKTVRDAIANMRLEEPERARATAASPLSRWLRGGAEATSMRMSGKPISGRLLMGRIPGGGGITFRIQAATRSDDASGQEAVQEVIPPRIIDRLAFYGGVSRMSQQFMTGTGGDYRLMQMDGQDQEGEILDAQNTAVTLQDLANIGIQNFLARTCSSKSILLAREMLQDSVFDIQGYAERQAVRRMGRIWNRAFTLGTNDGAGAGGAGSAGANRSHGVVAAASAGLTTASAASFTWPELTSLIYKINRAYREGNEMGEGGFNAEMGGVLGYMISDGAEEKARIMTDGDNRPLWVPSTREGVPNILNGYPYVVNGHMAGVATGTIPMLFGNFSYYGIRTVAMVEIFRFMDSRTMQNNTVEILAFSRRDGRPMGAIVANDCEAIAKLTMA